MHTVERSAMRQAANDVFFLNKSVEISIVHALVSFITHLLRLFPARANTMVYAGLMQQDRNR